MLDKWEKFIRESYEDDNEEYHGSHRPSKTSPVYDLTKGDIIPDDIYTHPHYYANMNDKAYRESFHAIMKVRGRPNDVVTIYRAAPREELNTGDWVTLSKTYAEKHAMMNDNPEDDMPVFSFKVPAKDVYFAGDDLNEFGYWGEPINK